MPGAFWRKIRKLDTRQPPILDTRMRSSWISHWLPVLIDSAVIVSSIFSPSGPAVVYEFSIRLGSVWHGGRGGGGRGGESERDDQVYTTVIKQLQTFEVYMDISFYAYFLQCL